MRLYNNGEILFGPEIDSEADLKAQGFETRGSLKILFNKKDYLTKVEDIRWNLQAKNKYSTTYGEEDNMYLIVVVDERPRSDTQDTVRIINYFALVSRKKKNVMILLSFDFLIFG